MNSLFLVHLFHILIIGSLFLYVGIYNSKIVSWMYPFLLILGVFIIAYHSFSAYSYIMKGKSAWVNLFHIIIVAPLLIYIGYKNKTTPYSAYQFVLMLAFAVIGYHGYYLLQNK
jgi:hypothetical protein